MATRSTKVGYFAALVAILILSTLAAAAESGKPSPKIEPKAEELLKKACATLAAEKNLEFHAEVTFDEVLPSGVKLQYAGALDLARELPDHLAVAFDSDLGSKCFWYDGKTVTLLDSAHKVYGSIPVESSIDGMLTEIQEKAKFTVPLSDFAVADPAEVLKRATFGISWAVAVAKVRSFAVVRCMGSDRPSRKRPGRSYERTSSSSNLVSFRSAVSKLSVNQP